MKIERGILIADDNVQSVGGLYPINYSTFIQNKSKIGDKLLGFINVSLFNVCYKFTLKSEESFIGFIAINAEKSLLVQTIQEFDFRNLPFDFYVREYELGHRIKIERNEISDVKAISY